MTFAIGQKVICIWSKHNKVPRDFNRPKFMQIYTIRAYCPCADISAVLLQEITNREVTFVRTKRHGEASFSERWFRPLELLDIEVLDEEHA